MLDSIKSTYNNFRNRFPDNELESLPGAFYIPSVLNEEEESQFFNRCKDVISKVGQKDGYISGKSGPKVKAFLSKYEKYPDYLEELIDKYMKKELIEVNPWQISMNLYEAGDLMVPHKDGSGTMAVITTLGSPLILDFYYKPTTKFVNKTQVFIKQKSNNGELMSVEIQNTPTCSVIMEPGSVLLLTGESFVYYAHAIEGKEKDKITKKVVNLSYHNKYKVGDKIKRKSRVSIVMWDYRK